ncbi:MAG: two-component regulator propeller domain-containing protein, partial [Rufibacter sp.]
MRLRLSFWLLSLLLLLGGKQGHAVPQPASYVYLRLSQEDGLASNNVLALLQDQKGFLWIGTDNGLQYYDGHRFLHYRHQAQNPSSLASDLVEALLQDTAGNIWIASGTTVTFFNPRQRRFRRVPLPQNRNPKRFRDTELFQDAQGRIWFLSALNQEAFYYSAARKAFVPSTGKAPISPKGQLRQTYLPDMGAPPEAEYVFLKDRHGTVWAGEGQLQVLSPGTSAFQVLPKEVGRYGLDFNRIACLLQDREGTLWLGTDKGIYYFHQMQQRFFSVQPPAVTTQDSRSRGVTAFLELPQRQELWVASLEGEIMVYDLQFNLKRRYFFTDAQGKPSAVWCLAQEASGGIWAAGFGGRMLKINPATGTGPEYVQPTALAGQGIMQTGKDQNGVLWWGTDRGQLVRFDEGQQQFTALSLPKETQAWGRIKRILPGSGNNLWVATSHGGIFQVNALTGAIVQKIDTQTKLKLLSNEIGDLLWYNKHTLLVTSVAGLHFIDLRKKKVCTVTTAQGLPANAVLNALKAPNGNLILTTQQSVFQWNAKTGNVTNYTAKDGILHQTFGFSVSATLQDGRMLLGTLQDFFYFHPDSLQERRPPPKVQFTGLQVFHQPLSLDSALQQHQRLELTYRQNFFMVEFASPSYYDQDKITYYYKLEGFDPDWVKAGQARAAAYTNVPGGNYVLRVKAERYGQFTEQETALAIYIQSPFWQTPWFYLLLALTFAGVLYALYRFPINRLLAMQQVRTRIARDLHDDVGSTLSTINILAEVAQR